MRRHKYTKLMGKKLIEDNKLLQKAIRLIICILSDKVIAIRYEPFDRKWIDPINGVIEAQRAPEFVFRQNDGARLSRYRLLFGFS
jgi:hypothetical protein